MPSPARALRDLNTRESVPKRTGLEEALQPSAGLEEFQLEVEQEWTIPSGEVLGKIRNITRDGALVGRVVYLDGDRVKLSSHWNPEIDNPDFPQWQNPPAPLDPEQKARLDQTGLKPDQWRQRLETLEPEPLVLLTDNFQADFYQPWEFLIAGGQVVRQQYAREQYPIDAASLREKEGYDDALFFFVLEPGPPRVAALRFEGERVAEELTGFSLQEGRPVGTGIVRNPSVTHALAAIPLLLNGEDVSDQARSNRVPAPREVRPNEVVWPTDRAGSFSVIGTKNGGPPILMSVTAHLTLQEVAKLMQEAGMTDGGLRQGSGGVLQWLAGESHPPLHGTADPRSDRAGETSVRPFNAVLAGREVPAGPGKEEEPMLPARATDYSEEAFLRRGFFPLDQEYDELLDETIREEISRGGGAPVKVLFIGVGRGSEAIQAQENYGTAVEVWAVNKKAGEFFDAAGLREHPGVLASGREEKKETLRAFRKVRGRLKILDLQDPPPGPLDAHFGGERFPVVVFGRNVLIYFEDQIEAMNRILRELVAERGTLFALPSMGGKVEGGGTLREYFLKFSYEDPRVRVMSPHKGGVLFKNEGGLQIPLEKIPREELPPNATASDPTYRSRPKSAGLEEVGRPGKPPEETAVVFGGGLIGHGRLGLMLSVENDMDVIFVEPKQELIDAVQGLDSYTVAPMGTGDSTRVENVWWLSLYDEENIFTQGKRADWVFTSVRRENLLSLAPILRQMILERMEAGREAPFNIVFAENLPVDQPEVGQMKEKILEGQMDGFRQYVESRVGFVGAIVEGGVPPQPPPQAGVSLQFLVSPGSYALLLDANAIRGPPPLFRGNIRLVPDIRAYRERKALLHNMPQAVLGYLAAAKGYPDSRMAMTDPEILLVAAQAAYDSAQALASRYPEVFATDGRSAREELLAYAHEFLLEYADPEFSTSVKLLTRSPVAKLEPNERLFAAARNCVEAGIRPDAIALGIAAARLFVNRNALKLRLNPKEIERVQAGILREAKRLGLALPRNTEREFLAAWSAMAADTGSPELTVPPPAQRLVLPSYDALAEQEAQAILTARAGSSQCPYWAGASGPVAAGKTSFLANVEGRLRAAGVHVEHLTEDELGVIDRATRDEWERQGDPKAKEWREWIRWGKILGDIARVNEAGRLARETGEPRQVTLEGLYSRATGGTIDGSRPITIWPDSVVLYDGILLAEKYPAGTFGRLVTFDIPPRESLRRSILRDFIMGRDPRAVLRLQREIYIPLWTSYISRFQPELRSDAVYDLSDFRRPVQLFHGSSAGLEEQKHILVVGVSEEAVQRVIEAALAAHPGVAFSPLLFGEGGGFSWGGIGHLRFDGALWLTPQAQGGQEPEIGWWSTVEGLLRGLGVPIVPLSEAAETPVREAVEKLLAFQPDDEALLRIRMLREFTDRAFWDWLGRVRGGDTMLSFEYFLHGRHDADPALGEAGIRWADLRELYWGGPLATTPEAYMEEICLYPVTAHIFHRLNSAYGDPERSTEPEAVLKMLRPDIATMPMLIFPNRREEVNLAKAEPEILRRIAVARRIVGLAGAAGLEEGPVRAERITPEQFVRIFPGERMPAGARGAYLFPGQAGSRVNIYSAHETLWGQLRQWLDGERVALPEGVEVSLLRLPADPGKLKAPGVIVKDWMLKLPYGQQLLPELEAAVGKPLPAIHSLILYALKGAEGQVEAVIGVMTLRDAQGNTVLAYFV